VSGYLAYWDELLRRHPDMLIDTCAGGGRRDDLETLRRAVPLWRSDYAFDDPPAMQDLSYGLAMWVPYFGTAARSSNPYSFRSAMVMAVTMQADSRSKTVDFPAINKLAAQWREVAPYYYGDYYPLTPYSIDDSAWMAWQYNRPEKGDGMVQAFRRAQSPIEKVRFKLRGLDATAQYAVRNLDQPGELRFSGRELEEQGLPVEIKDVPAAVIITYQQVKGSH
jgi:alpha-galactosidase